MNDARRDLLLAQYYDLEYRQCRDDVDFYLQFAHWADPACREPVLELGCGTGRVALALSQAGFSVTAVDLSPGMLQVSMQAAEQSGVGDKLRLMQADMRLPSGLDGGYALALCALNTFAYLPTTEDQLQMLRATKALLKSDGWLLLDLTPPLPGLLVPNNGELLHQGSFRDDTTNFMVHKFVSGTVDHAGQMHRVTIFYEEEGADGRLSRVSQGLDLRWTGRYEMELLLRMSGYRLENVYGDYSLGEYMEGSERMIFAARLDQTTDAHGE